MIVRIIKSNDDGEVLEDKTYRQYTEKEWTKQMYKLRKNAIGHVESWSRLSVVPQLRPVYPVLLLTASVTALPRWECNHPESLQFLWTSSWRSAG